ncbi:MAG TPA: methyltransferase domain-containing protein [Myxococcales bacterium LLY-WYZ-16_1]|jgi:sarcosine/dimethylglycine N-methyltransferase|nr:methyltransferase domain-containing protein [Myxococcales bacterium LLY-WYZ-16_1]
MSTEVTKVAQDYYNSDDADHFYFQVWGGEDIHVGLYRSDDEPIRDASRRTVADMANRLSLTPQTRLLDIGAGYGGAARFLAQEYGLRHVVCLNLSETQNERNRQMSREAGLGDRIRVVDGAFENIPEPDQDFDVVWCQDSILHSGDKARVFREVFRVLKPGGTFIFTDPMQADDADPAQLGPVLARIHLEEMGSFRKYREIAKEVGFRVVDIEDHSHQLPRHYGRVKQELEAHRKRLEETCSPGYLDRMTQGLQHWVDAGRAGHLAWGILQFERPA